MDDATLNPQPDDSQGERAQTGHIVERLVSELGQVDGEPVPLDGGITNRNFRARLGGRDYVIRVPGKDTGLLGIDREAECLANERAAEIGIAPPVAAFLEDPPCIVTEFVEGESLSPEQLRASPQLERVASALRSLHELEQRLSSRFDSVRIVEDYAQVASERGAEVPREYVPALERAREVGAALKGAEHTPVPCHNDLLAANFIQGEDRTWIVDWEYAGMGDRYFDLANFSVNNDLSPDDQERLLAEYFGERPGAGRLAALNLMAFMSDFREAMWGVVQSAVSEIEFDFDGYAGDHFERLGKRAADPDFDRWLEVAGGA
jgi:thiamine kinase-like enzyme